MRLSADVYIRADVYLYIKDGIRIDNLTGLFLDVSGKVLLVFQFDFCKLFQNLLII